MCEDKNATFKRLFSDYRKIEYSKTAYSVTVELTNWKYHDEGHYLLTLNVEDVCTEDTLFHTDTVVPYYFNESGMIRRAIQEFDQLAEEWSARCIPSSEKS